MPKRGAVLYICLLILIILLSWPTYAFECADVDIDKLRGTPDYTDCMDNDPEFREQQLTQNPPDDEALQYVLDNPSDDITLISYDILKEKTDQLDPAHYEYLTIDQICSDASCSESLLSQMEPVKRKDALTELAKRNLLDVYLNKGNAAEISVSTTPGRFDYDDTSQVATISGDSETTINIGSFTAADRIEVNQDGSVTVTAAGKTISFESGTSNIRRMPDGSIVAGDTIHSEIQNGDTQVVIHEASEMNVQPGGTYDFGDIARLEYSSLSSSFSASDARDVTIDPNRAVTAGEISAFQDNAYQVIDAHNFTRTPDSLFAGRADLVVANVSDRVSYEIHGGSEISITQDAANITFAKSVVIRKDSGSIKLENASGITVNPDGSYQARHIDRILENNLLILGAINITSTETDLTADWIDSAIITNSVAAGVADFSYDRESKFQVDAAELVIAGDSQFRDIGSSGTTKSAFTVDETGNLTHAVVVSSEDNNTFTINPGFSNNPFHFDFDEGELIDFNLLEPMLINLSTFAGFSFQLSADTGLNVRACGNGSLVMINETILRLNDSILSFSGIINETVNSCGTGFTDVWYGYGARCVNLSPGASYDYTTEDTFQFKAVNRSNYLCLQKTVFEKPESYDSLISLTVDPFIELSKNFIYSKLLSKHYMPVINARNIGAHEKAGHCKINASSIDSKVRTYSGHFEIIETRTDRMFKVHDNIDLTISHYASEKDGEIDIYADKLIESYQDGGLFTIYAK